MREAEQGPSLGLALHPSESKVLEGAEGRLVQDEDRNNNVPDDRVVRGSLV